MGLITQSKAQAIVGSNNLKHMYSLKAILYQWETKRSSRSFYTIGRLRILMEDLLRPKWKPDSLEPSLSLFSFPSRWSLMIELHTASNFQFTSHSRNLLKRNEKRRLSNSSLWIRLPAEHGLGCPLKKRLYHLQFRVWSSQCCLHSLYFCWLQET